jgi:predicted O-methyltransferase YrrM
MEFPNWFNYTAKDNFEKFLIPLAGQQNLKFLQLGAYTGDASVWMCKKVLTGRDSRLVDIDTWKGSDEEAHESIDFDKVYEIYSEKIKDLPVTPIVMTTTKYLITTNNVVQKAYDFIYVDADHTTVGVLMDAELSFPLLKSGGIMAFDDYTWGPEMPPHLTPTLGIDLFLSRHEQEYETLIMNEQVWIKKK